MNGLVVLTEAWRVCLDVHTVKQMVIKGDINSVRPSNRGLSFQEEKHILRSHKRNREITRTKIVNTSYWSEVVVTQQALDSPCTL